MSILKTFLNLKIICAYIYIYYYDGVKYINYKLIGLERKINHLFSCKECLQHNLSFKIINTLEYFSAVGLAE